MLDSEQALLFDKNRGRHVLVEIGEAIGDYIVSGIEEEEVTLTGKDLPVDVVLAVPESKAAAKQARKAKKAEKAAAAAADAAAAAEIEAADAAEADEELEDPYEDKPAVAARKAPADPYADEESAEDKTARDFSEAIAADDDEEEDKPQPKKDAPAKLSKKEVALALNDFSVLAKSIDGSFTKTGLLLEKVAPGSVFAKAGLTVGDVVMGIDGKPLRTIDDAADLYARAATIKNANVQILRSGKPQTLRVLIQ